MTHKNAPLTVEGRHRVIERCRTRPIAHVAKEMGISRACASKWVNRWRRHGELGLHDRSSTPHHSPTATPAHVVALIETSRREKKWSAQRITHDLSEQGIRLNRRTVTRHLAHLGLNHRRFLHPNGESNRQPGRITARWPGHMIHLDVKKVGRIPDGGGWRIHGRDSAQNRAADRAKTAGAKAGYTYLHSAIDGYSRLAYTEPLADEKGATAATFLARSIGQRARHQRTKPYTPRHNGKVERYQRILAEELLYAREFTNEDARSSAIAIWNIHYNYHRPHSGSGGQPPVSRLRVGVTNVVPSYS
ncbi:putative transposase [Mycolicibacterium conceptionense]|uniref:Transposase n=1 Tax=Mycolicibacterium conceptionense TaxID=451644 RepID=A0A0U1DJ33_9MYCO|nr:leucine zipper domain-containing protein [Mycolicibacterium conceptionense]ORV24656.1 transposase [Mycolicibacterium conceptionense]CQD16638.1 putative transposase [Mycolicibacterium conceptionense]